MYISNLLDQITETLGDDDLHGLQKLGSIFAEGENQQRPFQPDIRILTQSANLEDESDVVLEAANLWSRALRLLKFRRKIRDGYSGTIIVSEGDSWFQYPILLKDVVENLTGGFAVNSLGAAGDTLANIRYTREYRNAIANYDADVFLFSAAGNDIFGDGNIGTLLNRYQTGMQLDEVFNHDEINATLSDIEAGFEAIIRDAIAVKRGLKILIHGYDRPVPRRDGKWLGRPMSELGIPDTMQTAVAGRLIDKLNTRLQRIEQRFPSSVRHVDCRGCVGSSTNSWYDELHPKNPGYARMAKLFEQRIASFDAASRPVRGYRPILETGNIPRTSCEEVFAKLKINIKDLAIANASETKPMCAVEQRGLSKPSTGWKH